MLRLISIIGIAIAMVIGFVAISSKMKDDYTVRGRIVDVIKQMKDVAASELQCDKPAESAATDPGLAPAPDINQGSTTETENVKPAEVEMSSDLQTEPLIDKSEASKTEQSTTSTSSEKDNGATPAEATTQEAQTPTDSEQSTESAAQETSGDGEQLQNRDVDQNSDIIRSLGYRNIDTGKVEVVVIFSDVYGDSGKMHIQAGNKIIVHCTCQSTMMACRITNSDINSNFLPKTLASQ